MTTRTPLLSVLLGLLFAVSASAQMAVTASGSHGSNRVGVTITGEPSATTQFEIRIYRTYIGEDGHAHSELIGKAKKRRSSDGPDKVKVELNEGVTLQRGERIYVYVQANNHTHASANHFFTVK